MKDRDRDRFDAVLERVIGGLPEPIRDRFDEIPIIVLDEPTPEILESIGVATDDPEAIEDALEEMCGLHTGVPLTERSVEDPPDLPGIHIFRRGIIGLAADIGGADELERQVRITLLHELGHHFGLDEDDLEDLGYG